jgi:PAS domain S-box-containing protein
MLKNNDYVYFPALELMPPQARNELGILFDLDIKSFLAVPLHFNQRLVGFMGFTSIISSRGWTKQDVDLLKVAGEIFISTLERRRSENIISNGSILFNRLNEGVIIFDNRGTISWVNQASAAITGYSPDELLNRSIYSLPFLTNSSQNKLAAIMQQVKTRGKWQGQIESTRKNGDTFYSYFYISTTQDTTDCSTYYFAVIVDITSQVILERERAQLKKHTLTAQRLASLSTLSAGIVHEIAQPLNAIKVLADSMIYWHQTGNSMDINELIPRLQEISNETEKVNEIINYIRSFSNFKPNELINLKTRMRRCKSVQQRHQSTTTTTTKAYAMVRTRRLLMTWIRK